MYVNDDMQKLAMSIVSNLRLGGIITEVDLLGRALKKQMEAASDSKFAIIVAPKEFAEKKLVLRNMSDGTETQISIDDLISDPKSILNL